MDAYFLPGPLLHGIVMLRRKKLGEQFSFSAMQHSIFTIGHSNQDVPAFLKLLADNSVQVVVDVRSAPYSRYAFQFNKNEIQSAVFEAGLNYIYMGDVIGGKPTDLEYLDVNGRVLYERLSESEEFQKGLDRLRTGLSAGWVICLVCAEEDPLKCHRHLLIAHELEFKRNIAVLHIRSDGTKLRARDHLIAESCQMRLF